MGYRTTSSGPSDKETVAGRVFNKRRHVFENPVKPLATQDRGLRGGPNGPMQMSHVLTVCDRDNRTAIVPSRGNEQVVVFVLFVGKARFGFLAVSRHQSATRLQWRVAVVTLAAVKVA